MKNNKYRITMVNFHTLETEKYRILKKILKQYKLYLKLRIGFHKWQFSLRAILWYAHNKNLYNTFSLITDNGQVTI